jgi:hypothetical protein
VTTILAKRVGSSVVSAITQTPASGPVALVTTPPISSLSSWTALVSPLIRAAHAAITAAMITANMLRQRLCFLLIRRLLSFSRKPETTTPLDLLMPLNHGCSVEKFYPSDFSIAVGDYRRTNFGVN